MNEAIYREKGLAAVRYPRGSEKNDSSCNYVTNDHILIGRGESDTLIITYGRIFSEALKAQSILCGYGINCDLLKLTKIYPLCSDIIDEIKDYRRVIFFEESMSSGSISEKIGTLLAESSFAGEYSRVTADGFIKQASIAECLDEMGLSCEKMILHIRKRSMKNGEA